MPHTSTVHAMTALGIDMGKNALHMIGLDLSGAIVLREKVLRERITSRLCEFAALSRWHPSGAGDTLRCHHRPPPGETDIITATASFAPTAQAPSLPLIRNAKALPWGNSQARLARGLAGPTLECMGQGANLLIAKQPSDLRYRQIFIGQITAGEINFQVLQDIGKIQTFRSEPPRKGALTKAESSCDR